MEEERTAPTPEEEGQALGITTEVLDYLRRALAAPTENDENPVNPETPPPDEREAAARAEAREREAAEARQAALLREEGEIAAVCPGFTLEGFRAAHPEEAAALDGGAGLWPAAAPVLLADAQRQAEDAVVERIRRRNAGLPRPLAAGPDAAPADYAAMSSEAFARTRADLERRMREGRRVRP